MTIIAKPNPNGQRSVGRSGRSRVLVIGLGSTGDVNPMLGIASTLERRGHDVEFGANPVFERFARAAGVRFVPIGTETDYEFIWDRRTWQWWRCMDTAFRKGWLPLLRPVYESIASRAGGFRLVVVANLVAPGAMVAQERLGVPLALVTCSPLVFRSLEAFPDYGPFQRSPRWLGKPARVLFYRMEDAFIDFWIAKGFNGLRSELGLAPIRRIFSRWMSSGNRILGLWPEWYAPRQKSWPSQLVLSGFPNYDRGDLETDRALSEAKLPRSELPIVFTCGSAMTHAETFLSVAGEVGKRLDRRVLVVTDQPVRLPQTWPQHVECRSYTPFRELLPRASAIVHHGGVGTTAAALAAGIPQVIVPLAFDQFDNAERCVKLGVARRVARRRFRASRVAQAIRELAESQSVAERCRHWRAQMRSVEPLVSACKIVEELLG